MSKLIIFEGADNTGKTTALNTMMTKPTNERKSLVKAHFSKPEGGHPLGRFEPLLHKSLALTPDYIFWDRGPISTWVYEGYYREPIGENLVKKVLISLASTCEAEILLYTRAWEKACESHLRELAKGAIDPNGATLLDRELIHKRWEKAAVIFSDYVTIINQEW